MNKKKQLNQAVAKMIEIGAASKSEAEMFEKMRGLSRKDRRILMREGKKRKEKKPDNN